MSEVTYFTDEHISRQTVNQIVTKGIDVVRCEDVGMKCDTDEALLVYAADNRYTLLSMDDDVIRLYYEWIGQERDHYGIVYAAMAKFKGDVGIGPIVTFCVELAQLIENGTGTIEDDLKNELFRL